MLLILIFGVIMLSGLIAYIGDQIGMKIGKKRLSIFGIRPKYTSIIITVLTGIMIATISITLLMIASKGVRMAVFDMQKLVAELGSLNQQVHNRDLRLQDMAKQIDEKVASLTELKKEQEELQVALNVKTGEMAVKQQEYDALQAQMRRAQDDYENLARTNMELEKSKATLDQKIAEIEKQKKELEEQKGSLMTDVSSLETELVTLNSELLKVTDNLEKLQRKAVQLELHTDNASMLFPKGQLIYMESVNATPGGSLSEAVKVIQDYVNRANRFVQKYPVAVAAEGYSIKVLTEQYYELYKDLINPNNEKMLIGLYSSKNIWADEYVDATLIWERNYRVFRQGEVIAYKFVDPVLDATAIEQQLLEMLREISQRSRERGLLPAPSGEVGQINFFDILNLTQNISKQSGRVKVVVRATQDIWRHDALSTKNNLKFDVEMVFQ